MSGRIVVFGATGYTGEQTARALIARGARPVLAGRSRDRLEPLADQLGGLGTAVADVAQPATVRALVEQGDVLVSTVGPFIRWGDPAVQAAIDAGATYIDSTGEPAFIRRVFETFGPRADTPLLTAFGFDWVPGNIAGALALLEAGPGATRVDIGYFTRSGVSGGTRASLVSALLEPSFAFRDGRLRREPSGLRTRGFALPDGTRRSAVSVGGSEHFGLPATHAALRDVDVLLGQAGPHVRAMPLIARGLDATLRVPGLRRRLLAIAEKRISGSTGGPDEAARERGSSTVVAQASDAAGRRLAEVVLHGVDPYTFTFGMLAWAATHEAAGSGALAPTQAYELDALVSGAAEAGLHRTDRGGTR